MALLRGDYATAWLNSSDIERREALYLKSTMTHELIPELRKYAK